MLKRDVAYKLFSYSGAWIGSNSGFRRWLFLSNLPSPAYKLERVEVEIKGNGIELTPLAIDDRRKMAVQELVPFAPAVKLKLPSAGEYLIRKA